MTKLSGIKDMASSVDWGKIMSGSDARNAVIGSALGGLLVGGASMASDRDPEESKYAPVGDALTGALLGGVAGYGIPKGLALFRDSGSLAPDNDKLRYNFTRAGLFGGAAGAGVIGASAVKTLRREARSRLEALDAGERAAAETRAAAALASAQRGGNPVDIARAKNRLAMFGVDAEGNRIANELLDDLRRRRVGMRGAAGRALGREIKELTRLRKQMTRGYSSIADLVRQVGETGNGVNRPGVLDAILHPRKWLRAFSNQGHYHTGRLLGFGPKLGAGVRMGLRAGKYGLAGAGAAMLLHKLLGPSTQSNFKKG